MKPYEAFYQLVRSEGTAADASVTLTPPLEGRIYLVRVYASYSQSSQSGTLTVSTDAGATILFRMDIHGSDGVVFEKAFDTDKALTVTLSAGGAGIVGRVNVFYAVL